MSSEEPKHSLAEDAAAWVPPWERHPSDAAAEAKPEAAVPAGPGVAAAPGTAVPAEPEAAVPAEPEADGEAEFVAEPDREAEPEFAVDAAEPDHPADPTEPDEVPGVGGTPADAQPEPVADLADAAGPAAEIVPPPDGVERVPLDGAELRGALEAIMLVVDEPVTEVVLAQVLAQPTGVVADSLGELAEAYARDGRGFELRRAAGGWRLYTRGEYASYVERFVLDGQQVRITQAALETLAVVAYKQPVTRSRISAIRGVNCDGVIRTLVSRGLIEECGTEPESGAFLFRTTSLFLEKVGLDSVEELPSLAPFLPNDMDDIADAQR